VMETKRRLKLKNQNRSSEHPIFTCVQLQLRS
jgi:hypothetical protein